VEAATNLEKSAAAPLLRAGVTSRQGVAISRLRAISPRCRDDGVRPGSGYHGNVTPAGSWHHGNITPAGSWYRCNITPAGSWYRSMLTPPGAWCRR